MNTSSEISLLRELEYNSKKEYIKQQKRNNSHRQTDTTEKKSKFESSLEEHVNFRKEVENKTDKKNKEKQKIHKTLYKLNENM
ncbi:hypothetical protein RFI_02530 [Reticulomyxa filosa]|uniref:Uncharacterized protein n=1 Tax=Reticulomyxa filosa TaxID=46433 RepID=X6P926_RETFI|nr:hypothetical protein RFI_02530 [Reticulomyxa filosa]|eukprot:ETO34564.1 hypothetical protein RFI_02530 [Reticulomyxa filosa]